LLPWQEDEMNKLRGSLQLMSGARQRGKVGILLSNLGTPDGTDYGSVRRYLSEFLSDRRVIELPKLLWQPILQGVVLLRRPAAKGKDYERIWNRELDESPLKTVTRQQAVKLGEWAEEMFGQGRVAVDWGMRYGSPSIDDAVSRLTDAGCDRILMFPLYPQYSATTTATANDRFFEVLRSMRNQPSARVVPSYFDDPAYIQALARSVENGIATLTEEPEVVIASFHGIPKRNVQLGDPYYEQCQLTGELLREALGLPATRFRTTYQSRFGYADWLQPYTDATVRQLAQDGIRRVAVLSPGFVADCIETVDEIGRENAAFFREAGGHTFTVIPCLNDGDDGMAVLQDCVLRETRGWL
jgi:ferrochelatase